MKPENQKQFKKDLQSIDRKLIEKEKAQIEGLKDRLHGLIQDREYQRDLRINTKYEVQKAVKEMDQRIDAQKCLEQSVKLKLRLDIWIDVPALRDEIAELNLLSHQKQTWEAIIDEVERRQRDRGL